jgi:hypothetical protein
VKDQKQKPQNTLGAVVAPSEPAGAVALAMSATLAAKMSTGVFTIQPVQHSDLCFLARASVTESCMRLQCEPMYLCPWLNFNAKSSWSAAGGNILFFLKRSL